MVDTSLIGKTGKVFINGEDVCVRIVCFQKELNSVTVVRTEDETLVSVRFHLSEIQLDEKREGKG